LVRAKPSVAAIDRNTGKGYENTLLAKLYRMEDMTKISASKSIARRSVAAGGGAPRRNANGRTKLQQEQKESSRQRLLDAARALYTRISYAVTTVDDIVRDAQVSRTTFYRHFDGKLAIAEALFQEAMIPIGAIHEELASHEDPSEKDITRWINQLIDHLIANRTLVRIMREVEAIEPASNSAQTDTHKHLFQLYAIRIPAFRLAVSNGPGSLEARVRANLLMLQFDQFFYAVAVRESIDRKVGVRVMARELRRFIEEVGAKARPRARAKA
jgi:AcrR family transcriptional regulator